jgi:tRNA G18 (ribose-2'-O)-methylase SpoU
MNTEVPNTIASVNHPDNRNVIDYYKHMTVCDIKADLDRKRHNFSVLISNIFHDFNIGTVIRNCNAYLATKIYIYGRKKFDRRGCVGTYFYENIEHIDSLDALPPRSEAHYVGVDNVPGAVPKDKMVYCDTKHTIFCFGQEQVGLPDEVLDFVDVVTYIRQYGSVRSLNVGTASGIMMDDYCTKMVKED